MGGKLECLCFASGSGDVVIIVEVPDNFSAAAICMTVAATEPVGALSG
ncbi:MAG: GYD domain-containing protein [Alphaproteobacteria bacterium]|nr:GYD domain-containing protein [Alphaproteobacteria bacterium]